jgi:hypothetical protein
MITATISRTQTRYADKEGRAFKVTALYAPNEEPDTWVAYHNERTGQEYTCRLEAFLARFSEIAND